MLSDQGLKELVVTGIIQIISRSTRRLEILSQAEFNRSFIEMEEITTEKDRNICYSVIINTKSSKERFLAIEFLLTQEKPTFFDIKVALVFTTFKNQRARAEHLFINHVEFTGQDANTFHRLFT
jgi:hypothetical protein